MKNDKSNQALFKLELKVWIAKQVEKGKFKNEMEGVQYLTLKLGLHLREGKMKPYTVWTIKNYLYGDIWPVNWKHVKNLHKATKIPKRVLNPDVYGK